MKKIHVGLLMAASLLTGCAGFTGQGYVDDLNKADLGAGGFTAALASEYRDLANFEWTKMLDYRDGKHYAIKGLTAAGGEVVLPDEVATRDLPEFAVSDITEAHGRLVEVLDGGARDRVPALAAKAQASFDCWMEQQEENHQPDDIASCRKTFDETMAQIGPAKYVVFFDFGSSHLTPAARAIVRQAVADAKARHITEFSVVGHTDTVGSTNANRALSVGRANAVKAALVANGFRGRNVHVNGLGEGGQLVPTADGVKQAENRRAEISFK